MERKIVGYVLCAIATFCSAAAHAVPVTYDFSYVVTSNLDQTTGQYVAPSAVSYSGSVSWDLELATFFISTDGPDPVVRADGIGLTYQVDTPYGSLVPFENWPGTDAGGRSNGGGSQYSFDAVRDQMDGGSAGIQRRSLSIFGSSPSAAFLPDFRNLDALPDLSVAALNISITNDFLRSTGTYAPNSFQLLGTVTSIRARSTDVPEPATLALFGIAFAGMAFVRRRPAANKR